MPDTIATKEITKEETVTALNNNVLVFVNNNGNFAQAKLDDIFKTSGNFAILRGNGNPHNGLFRGKDLTNVYTIDQIYGMVANNTFDDLFLGDYFSFSITTTLPDGSSKTETSTLMIGVFNPRYNVGDTATTKPCIGLIPRNAGFATTSGMNDTNTTDGGYINSKMHKEVLPCYAKSLKTALKNHVITHRELLTNKMTPATPSMGGAGLTGASTGWGWADVDLCLMTEVEVFGTTVFSSSGYDVGSGCEKLPVFNFINPVQYQRGDFWLRAVASATNFAYCTSYGYPNNYGASNALYVRPLLLFG